MKLIIIFLISATSFIANAQTDTSQITSFDNYYPETKLRVIGKSINGILVDTLRSFYNNGKLKTIQVFKGNTYPREVYFVENLKSSYAKKLDGFYIQINDTTYIKSKVWKYYYKNGSVMDSVIYNDGIQVYRARIDKKGKIIFEEK